MPEKHSEFHSINGKRSILIIEDELITREILGYMLQDTYEVLYAEDGARALRILDEQCETLSLVLLDLNLPDMKGLDILQKIRKESRMKVEITEVDFEDIPEVDSKLVQLAQQVGGKIITNDFNLNKVAQLRGVEVLNINALSNAVKPVVIPGETMQVAIVKSGKEAGQGVAYLEDGTMIVVENGNRYMGENIEVEVTSALQTAAGRMIFAKPKN